MLSLNLSEAQALSNKTTKGPPFDNTTLVIVANISCVVLVVLIVFALFGNTLVWVAFITVKRLQRVTNFYIVSLATADLLVASFAMTTWLHMPFGGKFLTGGKAIVTIYTMTDIACGTASIMSLTFVSIDRCLAITKPFSYQTLLSPIRVLGTILFSWTYALAVALLKFWIVDSKNYTLFVLLVSFLIPTTIIIFTYSCIFSVALRHARVINAVSGNRNERKFSYVTEMKAAKVIGVVVGAFLVCWAPFLLTNLTVVYCLKCRLSVYGLYVLKLLQYANSALNPYIYTCLNADFRADVKRLVCRKCISSDTMTRVFLSGVRMVAGPLHRSATNVELAVIETRQ